MPLSRDPQKLSLLECASGVFGLHGAGWLAGGFYAQGLTRMVLGWILFVTIGITALFIADISGSLFVGAVVSPAWPMAAVVSSTQLRNRILSERPRDVLT